MFDPILTHPPLPFNALVALYPFDDLSALSLVSLTIGSYAIGWANCVSMARQVTADIVMYYTNIEGQYSECRLK